jgi:hypothetical protein
MELRENEKSPLIAGFCESLPTGATSHLPKRGHNAHSVTSASTSTSEKSKKLSGAKYGAFSNAPSDSRLQALITHWADIPESLRESIFRQVCETLILQKFTR